MNYVLIGNSTAAIGCIEGIRSVDQEGVITVLSEEPYEAYGRPLISYLLMGKTDREHMRYREPSFYETMGVELLLGRRAEKIDSKSKKILSPSHMGKPRSSAFLIQASSPSSQGWGVPVQPVAVNRCIYSVGAWSDTKVTSPR